MNEKQVLESLQRPSSSSKKGLSPEQHVQSIRETLFGIGSDRPKNLNHANNANNAIARLAMSAHASPFHFICELLQVSTGGTLGDRR